MNWWKILISILSLFFSLHHSFAQNISDFKKVEGLNSNVVYCVMQDSKGYIWVGTEAGAARYDGYKFTFFTMDEGLTDNDVFQIHEDSKGRLWFLTNNGKPCIYDKGRILNASNTNWLQAIQPKKLAKDFLEEKNGSIWFTCLDTVYHIVNDKVIEKLRLPKSHHSIDNIQTLIKQNDSIYLLHNTGIYNIQSKTNYLFNKKQLINSLHTRVLVNKQFVYFMLNNEIAFYSLKSHQSTTIFTLPTITDAFLTFIKTPNPDIVFISSNTYMYALNVTTQQCSIAKTLQVPWAINCINDKEGNTWLATFRKGLWLKQNNVFSASTKIDAPTLPKNARAKSIDIVDNKIYIGYEDGNYIVKQGHTVKHYKQTFQSVTQPIWQFTTINNQLAIVAANDVVCKTKRGDIFVTLTTKQVEQNNAYIYFASTAGLFKYPINKYHLFGKDESLRFIKNISTLRLVTLAIIAKDSIYVGGLIGLHLFVKDKLVNSFENYPVANASISKIFKLNNQIVAFSTFSKGIGIIAKDTIYTISKANGLFSNQCNSMYKINDSTFWIATAKGIQKLTYTIAKSKALHYKIEDYNSLLSIKNSNVTAILQTNDTLYYNTDEGAYYHKLPTAKPTTISPTTIIESVEINDSVYYEQNVFKADYKQSKYKINFIGLSYASSTPIKYKYQLLPKDTAWQYTENTTVEYPYLPPGKYIFKVVAALPNGNFNPKPASIEITIAKPFWQTIGFLLTMGLLVASIVFFMVRYIINNLKQKHQLENQQLVFDKQVTELEHKALRLQMNPHFIFNAINAIKGFYASNDIKNAKAYIDSFSSLMRLMLETGNDTLIKLSDELSILEYYLQLSALRYDNKFEYKISTALQTAASQISIPIMMLQPFVENAVIHGIAAVKEKGLIEIHIEQKDNLLICTISDNGIGRTKAANKSNTKMHLSKSIQITQQRLKIMGGLSALKIIDKVDENNNALGTLVQIILPLVD